MVELGCVNMVNFVFGVGVLGIYLLLDCDVLFLIVVFVVGGISLLFENLWIKLFCGLYVYIIMVDVLFDNLCFDMMLVGGDWIIVEDDD